jgi:hypothetical protein
MPTGTLPQSWSALPSSTSHEEALDLIDDVLDDTPEESPYKVLSNVFSTMKDFNAWKRIQNFNWITSHRSHRKGDYEENEPSFIHFRCNTCAICNVEMRAEYKRLSEGAFQIEVRQRGTHGATDKKMLRGMPPAMLNTARDFIKRGLKPNEVVRQILAQLHSDGLDDDKTFAQRLKQVQNLKQRMSKEDGNGGVEMTSMAQVREFTNRHVADRQDPVYFSKLGMCICSH